MNSIAPIPSINANGAKIPLVGLGTWELRGRSCARVVEQALRLGYRHIDTAEMYDNEREVGEGLQCLRRQAQRSISDHENLAVAFCAAWRWSAPLATALVRLRQSEVDLLLLHWPNPQIPLEETLGALCKVKRDGLARHIGVSNFTVAMIEEAVRISTEPLVCDQVECHPYLDQAKVLAACRANFMAMVAYSPIARGNAKNDKVLAKIGAAHEKTAAQVCLRYLVQQNIVVIPRTSKLDRLTENASIFDFKLNEMEMRAIAALARPDGRVVNFAYSGTIDWD